MSASDDLKALLDRFPGPDKGGTYANLDRGKVAAMEQVVTELMRRGPEAALGLIDMLVEPGRGDDVKPRFVLHLWAVCVTERGREKERAAFARALASQVLSDRPVAVRVFLIEGLQWAGGREVVETLGRALEEPGLCEPAARALAALGDGAAEVLLAALPRVRGRGRLSVIKKLAVLRARRAAVVFRKALIDPDPEVRIAGAWGIARIGDASAAETLLAAADAPHEQWERMHVTDACLALAETLAERGDRRTARTIYARLRRTRTDPSERHVREAAERGLAALG